MARSSYIYVICHDSPENPDPPHVIAAFTVKHELEKWLKRCTNPCKNEFVTYRMRDNDYTETYQCTAMEMRCPQGTPNTPA